MPHFMFFVMAMLYALCALQVSNAAPLLKLSVSARASPQLSRAVPPPLSGSLGSGAPDYANWLQTLRNPGGVFTRHSNSLSLSAIQEANARRDSSTGVITSINGIPIGHGISSFGAGAPFFNGGLLGHLWRRYLERSRAD